MRIVRSDVFAYYNSFFNSIDDLALSKELEEHNVSVQLVTPMFVRTKMNNYSTTVMLGKNFLIPDVEAYTKSAVYLLDKTSQTNGYWSHGLQVSQSLSFA